VHVRGLVGIGVAHILVISLITLPAYLVAIRRSTGVGPGPVLRALSRPVSAAGTAAIVAWIATASMQSDLLKVVVGGLTLSIVYVLLTASLLFQIVPITLPARWQRAGLIHRLTGPRARRRIPDGWE
jgi:hypothetical protein